jgi:type IV pilus assembly protein PilW
MLNSFPAFQYHRGVSLVETLVGLAVGLIVLTGAITMFMSSARYNSMTLSSAHLDQELRSAMSLISHDLRRAGYSAIEGDRDTNLDGTVDIDDLRLNPFSSGIVDVATGNLAGEAANSCITYAYNLDEEAGETVNVGGVVIAKPPTIGVCSNGCTLSGAFSSTPIFTPVNLPFDNDSMEMFGFRLREEALQMRTGLGGASTFDCSSGTWESYTNDAVEITQLNFNLTETEVEVAQADIDDADSSCQDGQPCICIRQVAVTLAGRLEAQTDIRQTLRETVRIRNDKFVASYSSATPCRP